MFIFGLLSFNIIKNKMINSFIFIFYLFILIFFFLFLNYIYLMSSLTYSISFYNYKMNFLGYSLFFSGCFVGLFIFFLSDSSLFFKKFLNNIYFLMFFVLIWFFMNEKSYINLFFMYEMFLMPSFYLVYAISPNRSSIPVAIYFLTWTQFGSIFVLMAMIYIYICTNSIYLSMNNQLNQNILFILLFMGFGMKIPMWPFYYWLTKTHVEASSFFSIYLSGFLVKTAIFLFNHFYSFFFNVNYLNFLFIIVMMGILDSSIKMWHQLDLKKLIAYSTVQEMNILFLPLLWNTEVSEMLVSLFVVTHALLSSLFFFMIDILNKRFNTRVTTKISGLIHTMPIFSICIFVSLLFFLATPFTIKFFVEISMFNLLFNYNINIFLIIFFVANFLGTMGFSKNIFIVLFGAPISNKIVYDLNKKEFLMFIFMFLLLFGLIFMTTVIF